MIVQKGGQVTKPIIVVKVPCKFLIKCSTSWPYLILEFLVAYITIVASDWPCTFLHLRYFCLALLLHINVSKVANKLSLSSSNSL